MKGFLLQLMIALSWMTTLVNASSEPFTIWFRDLKGYGFGDFSSDPSVLEISTAMKTNRLDEAVALAEKKAGEGEPMGEFLLGLIAESTLGKRPDPVKAELHYRKGERLHHLPSAVNLAALLLRRNQKDEESIALLNSILDREPGFAGYLLGAAVLGGALGNPEFTNVVNYWTQSAENGHPRAHTHLGLLYLGFYGFSESKDPKKAAEVLKTGSEQGDHEASVRLGILILESGEELGLTESEAEAAFASAARSEDVEALFLLGQVREQGVAGRDAMPTEARDLYKRGAESGHGPSALKYGFLLERGIGGPEDLPEAVKSYRLAADRNEPGGFFNLGLLHETGTGVEKDARKAFESFLAAGHLDFPPAADRIGNAYRHGMAVSQDFYAALAWFSRGAEAGDTNSMVSIAEMMLANQGAPYNPEVLKRLSEQAIKGGNPRAGLLIGRMAERGVLEDPDLIKALAHYRWTTAQGLAQAESDAGRVSRQMTPQMIQEAELLFQSLLDAIPAPSR